MKSSKKISSVSARKIGVIGAGVMGQALLAALIARKVCRADQLWFGTRSPEHTAAVAKNTGARWAESWRSELKETEIVLLCVKPAQVDAVLSRLKKEGLRKQTVVVSIAAGVSLARLERGLGKGFKVVRAMPNTPCLVGQGATAIALGRSVDHSTQADVEKIFSAVGRSFTLEEKHFDAVTGLSGSGPAYFLLILEAIADGGVRVGLPRALALELATQTMLGTATLVKDLGRHPAELRDDVTTPAGCTIAGLLILEDGRIRSTLARAIEEAARIARGLGGEKL